MIMKIKINEFYRLVAVDNDVEKVKKLIDNGVDINIIREDDTWQMNAAQYTLQLNKPSLKMYEMLDLLIESGINVHHRDSYGKNLLVSYLITCGMDKENSNKKQQTFNKIMKRKPLLQYERREWSRINIFDIAATVECLYLFDEHVENMTPEDLSMWENYRLARLLEEK